VREQEQNHVMQEMEDAPFLSLAALKICGT